METRALFMMGDVTNDSAPFLESRLGGIGVSAIGNVTRARPDWSQPDDPRLPSPVTTPSAPKSVAMEVGLRDHIWTIRELLNGHMSFRSNSSRQRNMYIPADAGSNIALNRELEAQMKRMAQIQLQLDDMRTELRQLIPHST